MTPAYLYAVYGLRVDGDPGSSSEPPRAWSADELSLLNDVIEALPPAVRDRMSRVQIRRAASALDPSGKPDASQFGLYLECDLDISPDCSGAAASVRIFDHAHTPSDFRADAQGDLQFKGTILHELTHALQNSPRQFPTDAQGSEAVQSHDSEFLQRAWVAATRSSWFASDAPYCPEQSGWVLVDGKWNIVSRSGNRPPTTYAATGPGEDMAESVMLYVYDPHRLKDSSLKRYDFIRDQIFGGVEYD